jgi:hypothetical protein
MIHMTLTLTPTETMRVGIDTARNVIDNLGPEGGVWAITTSMAHYPEPSDALLMVWLAHEVDGLRDEHFENLPNNWPDRCVKMAQALGHLDADGRATVKGVEAVTAFIDATHPAEGTNDS